MNRLRLAGLPVALALGACAAGPGGLARELRPAANPSAVVAVELAFARAAQERGQWTAFADYAADDAVMFVPQPVNARGWLKRQANPPQAVAWQPHQVWSSCDGSLAVTRGAWQQPDGATGYFTTVWKRQRDGSYKWVLDQGEALDQPLEAPEMISARVADCGRPVSEAAVSEAPAETGGGASDDHTLAYGWAVHGDGSRDISVALWNGEHLQDVFSDTVDAPRD